MFCYHDPGLALFLASDPPQQMLAEPSDSAGCRLVPAIGVSALMSAMIWVRALWS